jgi:hypothetical protein
MILHNAMTTRPLRRFARVNNLVCTHLVETTRQDWCETQLWPDFPGVWEDVTGTAVNSEWTKHPQTGVWLPP